VKSSCLVQALGDGKTVKISSFGTFQKYLAKPRTFKNIQTKEPIEVPSKNRVRFKAYKSLKEIMETSKKAAPRPLTST
jgi:DNA phosphorothioation-dependent restriction protein DptG